MTNPTSKYGFVMPTPTDLVTDLPADFEVFGQDVDSQMKTNADAATQKATLTTTGDIYYASGASTPARLGIGSTGNVLTVAGGIPSWAAPTGAYSTVQLFTSSTTFTVPAGITRCAVYAVGGGGGGGGGAVRVTSAGLAGGNGGNGGFLGQEPYYTVTPGASITVTIGAGGAGGAGASTISSATAGTAGTNGNNSVFGNLTAGGGAGGALGKTSGTNDPNDTTFAATFIAGRYAIAATSTPTAGIAPSGVMQVLTQAGSTGSAGTTPTVGTTLNAGGTSTNAGFGGAGGQGAGINNSTSFSYAGGNATESGGGGGGGAVSATNITTTAGNGGASATNRGGGGGGGGAAAKVGTTTTTVTAGTGGAGGSGFVAIFY